ncbi:MAG: tRNA (N6-threonylcarbamoyladenosine(37)-N6)-methyltransferase TrmO [Chitinophaga sp.]|uniref:tRNA (N6-threonylcarbamoyladenosine(37)-N6)-methyltransferase TrmO n=1 Tax=Chitinophaga sp. TaxID=1869181 RepID=UPI001B006080|nr:tRNA (N6-threonylcarbamoyladenosine(37)-N6)-methyltransferase TrmO [Chitinophaga sp.]MBO9732081.1 tRNA (N6-threonylcarbamoyladenosine(37)-N6)-methyltransferase TrmO [Chitinophaga sp.]
METNIKFIGKVDSILTSLEECPLQESENAPAAMITIFPEFITGIQHITEGTDLLLFTWLHKANRTVLACQPRNNPSAPLTGVFATRSPDRPNPIGIHEVKVLAVSPDGVIAVSGLEALDQTPVIDIKPVIRR